VGGIDAERLHGFYGATVTGGNLYDRQLCLQMKQRTGFSVLDTLFDG